MKKHEASSTSLLIAKGIVFSQGSSSIRTLIPPNAFELTFKLLQTAIGWKAWSYYIAGYIPFARVLVRYIESITVPGMILHYILRKLKIEDMAITTHEQMNGLDQLVIVAGGCDTLGLRLAAKYPQLRVYETDHPATQRVKQQCFAQQRIVKPQNFSLIPVDLTQQTLLASLKLNENFNFNKKTLFIAEGLFMYLPLNTVGHTLDIIKAFPEFTAQFIFTYMLPDMSGNPNFSHQSLRVNQWLAKKKEPFVWGFSPAKMDQYLLQRSLTPGKHFDQSVLRADYIINNKVLSKLPSAEGENITSITWMGFVERTTSATHNVKELNRL